MRRTTRRGFLAAATGVAATGVATGRRIRVESGEPAGQSNAAESGTAQSEVRQFSGTVRLRPGDHRSWGFEFADATTLSYDVIVRWGPKVDAFLFAAEEYRAYVKGYGARYIVEGTAMGTHNAPGLSVELPPGEYYLVVDNRDWDLAYPTTADGSQGRDVTREVPQDASDASKPLGVDVTFRTE